MPYIKQSIILDIKFKQKVLFSLKGSIIVEQKSYFFIRKYDNQTESLISSKESLISLPRNYHDKKRKY